MKTKQYRRKPIIVEVLRIEAGECLFEDDTENIRDIDFVKNISKLFFTELRKLDDYYKKQTYNI